MSFSPKENIMSFWLWAYKTFGWTQKEVDEFDLSDFLELYILTDKMENPENYRTGEYYFHS